MEGSEGGFRQEGELLGMAGQAHGFDLRPRNPACLTSAIPEHLSLSPNLSFPATYRKVRARDSACPVPQGPVPLPPAPEECPSTGRATLGRNNLQPASPGTKGTAELGLPLST